MAAKRRRKSQGDAPSAEDAEGTDAGDSAGSEASGQEGAEAQASADERVPVESSSGGKPAVPAAAPTRSAANAPARSVRELGQHTAATYQESRDAAADFVATARERIREQPVQSLLVAAGVGVLIGIIWR